MFFNDDDRINFRIAQSKNHFKEFKNAFHRAFEKVQTKEDHPELKKLLKDDAKLGGDGDDPNDNITSGRSVLGNGSKSDRAGKANSKVPP